MDLGNLMGMLVQSGALNNIAGQTGESPSATQAAVQALLPTLIGAVARNASSEQGASSLMDVLDSDHDGSALDDIVGLVGGAMAGTKTGNGAGIISHLLNGNQHASVTNVVSQQSGVSSSSAATIMQILAPVVMNYIGQQKNAQGLDAAGLIGSLIGGGQQQNAPTEHQSAISGMMGMLDMNHDGSSMDEIMSIGGSLLSNYFKK
jgi:hypothetical protein